jgi:hypothetical protein
VNVRTRQDDEWRKLSDARGSTAGGMYQRGEAVYYAKFPSAEGQIYAEHAADKLYELMGVESMNHAPITIGGKTGSVSKWKVVVPLGRHGWSNLTDEQVQQAAYSFVASALVKNWDVVGEAYANTGLTKEGNIAIIDSGGSFKYRARGEPKPFEADPTPELMALQDPQFPSGACFGPLLKMHRAKFVKAARKLCDIPDAELAKAARLMKDDALCKTLIERKKAIFDYFNSSEPTAAQRAAREQRYMAACAALARLAGSAAARAKIPRPIPRLFHYTTLTALPTIYKSGYLKRTSYDGLLWFSAREHWEPTAGQLIYKWDPAASRVVFEPDTCAHTMTFSEQNETFGCARFELVSHLPTFGWDLIKAVLRHRSDEPDRLSEPLAPGYTNHLYWQCCTHDVDLSHVKLEIWLQGKWQPASLPRVAAAISKFAAGVSASIPDTARLLSPREVAQLGSILQSSLENSSSADAVTMGTAAEQNR